MTKIDAFQPVWRNPDSHYIGTVCNLCGETLIYHHRPEAELKEAYDGFDQLLDEHLRADSTRWATEGLSEATA